MWHGTAELDRCQVCSPLPLLPVHREQARQFCPPHVLGGGGILAQVAFCGLHLKKNTPSWEHELNEGNKRMSGHKTLLSPLWRLHERRAE